MLRCVKCRHWKIAENAEGGFRRSCITNIDQLRSLLSYLSKPPRWAHSIERQNCFFELIWSVDEVIHFAELQVYDFLINWYECSLDCCLFPSRMTWQQLHWSGRKFWCPFSRSINSISPGVTRTFLISYFTIIQVCAITYNIIFSSFKFFNMIV